MTIADINTKARYLVDADTTSWTAAQLLIEINNAYEEIVATLIEMDKTWDFGDSNYASLATGLSNLTAGTQAYQLTSGWLTLSSVSVMDSNGLYNKLKPIIIDDKEPIEEYSKTDGMPTEYGKRGDWILLFPAPAAANVTTTNGLKQVTTRNADLFTSAQVTAGTKVPGFAAPYHQILSYKAALIYALSFKKDRVSFLERKIKQLEKSLIDFYMSRDGDSQTKITFKQRAFE